MSVAEREERRHARAHFRMAKLESALDTAMVERRGEGGDSFALVAGNRSRESQQRRYQ